MVSQNGTASSILPEEAQKPAKKPFNDYLSGIKTTVFSIMTELSLEHKSINLGQVRYNVGVCMGSIAREAGLL